MNNFPLFTPPFTLLTCLLLISNMGLSADDKGMLGKFNLKKDLLLPQFDSKTDVDDIHSIAGVATMLADPRFKSVNYHAVAGAYGNQEGLYVPANELFQLAFGNNWSDAHANFEKALDEVSPLAIKTLKGGGKVWIAEAGQSNFSAFLLRRLKQQLPTINYKTQFIIVQHSKWNQNVTDQRDLAYVKKEGGYHKIPDGNSGRNGTPQLRDEKIIDWKKHIKDERLIQIWDMAIEIANRFNGLNRRYLNKSIKAGGLDFSDVSEMTWIFGFADLKDADAFFAEFSRQKQHESNRNIRSASGILKHFPSGVRSVESWQGHTFKVGNTPVIPTKTVTREKLKSLIGKEVMVSGPWHPGKVWTPSADEPGQYPLGYEGKARGNGIRANALEVK